MAIQLELFDDILPKTREDVLLSRIEKMERDIHRMRQSFFVRLDAQEKRYVDLKDELNKILRS